MTTTLGRIFEKIADGDSLLPEERTQLVTWGNNAQIALSLLNSWFGGSTEPSISVARIDAAGDEVVLDSTGITVDSTSDSAESVRPLRVFNATTVPSGGPAVGPQFALHINDKTDTLPWGFATLSYMEPAGTERVSLFMHKDTTGDNNWWIASLEVEDDTPTKTVLKILHNKPFSEAQVEISSGFDDAYLRVGSGDEDAEVNRNFIHFPELTSTERDALSVRAGSVIWNTTTTQLEVYNGTSWVAV